MSQSVEIDRLKSLIGFAKEAISLRSSPIKTVSQYRMFKRFEEDFRALPGLYLNLFEGDDDEIWLRLERLTETKPPKPESKLLLAWIDLSQSPTILPKLKEEVEIVELNKIGISILQNVDNSNPNTISFGKFDDCELVERQFEAYLEVIWKSWAIKEKERRKSISLYAELFMLVQQFQGNLVDSQIELVWGVGVALWSSPSGLITHPILTQLVELSINEANMSIEVRPRSIAPRLEVDVYYSMDNPGVIKLEESAKKHFSQTSNILNPFVSSTFETLLFSAVTYLDAKGAYVSNAIDKTLPKALGQLAISDSWVLFARPRTNSLYIQDLERFEKQLGDNCYALPPAITSIVTDPSNISEEVSLPAFRGFSFIDGNGEFNRQEVKELYFPKPFNNEQVQIVQMLEMFDGVVVQGPPGTGKTHTIANIICHYLAQGKRVLVTSMKDPALAVLQEKLPEDIRALTISLLTSEAEGMKQFEYALSKISSEVQNTDKFSLRKEIEGLDMQIDNLHAQLGKIDREINKWAIDNINPIILDEEEVSACDAAKELASNMAEIDWFIDPISIGPEHGAKFGDQDIHVLRDSRLKLGDDLKYLGKKLPQLNDFPSVQKLLQVHEKLSRLSILKEKETKGDVPKLVNNQRETVEHAMSIASRISNLRILQRELEARNQSWIPQMVAYLRSNRKNEILDLFEDLRGEIKGAIGESVIFLAKPVSIPADFYKKEELIEAVQNIISGRRPFGITGLFGKSENKRSLDSVLVCGFKPQSIADWQHVSSFINIQKWSVSLLNRWNTVASAISIPRIEEVPNQLHLANQAIDLYDKLVAYLEEERQLTISLRELLPEWKRIDEISFNSSLFIEAEDIITHHLAKDRLTEAIEAKELFLNALSGCHGTIAVDIRTFLVSRLGNCEVDISIIHQEWSILLEELRRVWNLSPYLEIVTTVSSMIENSGAPNWALAIRTKVPNGSFDSLLPANWSNI